jgi:transcriptional regulator with PAS, ATPase and Fis domain
MPTALAVPSALTPALSPPTEAPIVVDPEMRRLYREAAELAAGRLPVLIVGETGVGKEHLAEALHQRSPRAAHPFLRINCAALGAALFESELFGHERGAFTGAEREKPGLLEAAGRGTVFLDEVGELPPPLQAKLLRALEAGGAHRVGGLRPRPIEARFVSATNRPLDPAAPGAGFRRDLYYRLAGSVLRVPPLRARPGEILPLAEAFAARAARELGRWPVALAPAARAALLAHPWWGNVRELRNAVERAVLLAREGIIGEEHLRDALAGPAAEGAGAELGPVDGAAAEEGTGAGDRRGRVLRALAACAGNQKQAARLLGIDRRTLSRWLDRLAIARPRKGGGGSPAGARC